MTGRRGPTIPHAPTRATVTRTQASALLRLREIVLDYPGAVAPTRDTGLNMGTLRALASKGLVGWRRLSETSQGVFVTVEGHGVAEDVLTAREAGNIAPDHH